MIRYVCVRGGLIMPFIGIDEVSNASCLSAPKKYKMLHNITKKKHKVITMILASSDVFHLAPQASPLMPYPYYAETYRSITCSVVRNWQTLA